MATTFYYYCYRPLLRIMPRSAAMFATFVACGFVLHDLRAWAFARRVLPPGAAIAFAVFGIGAVLSERLKWNLASEPVGVRAATNAAYVVGCIGAMLVIVSRT
jgi:hypothetical protein